VSGLTLNFDGQVNVPQLARVNVIRQTNFSVPSATPTIIPWEAATRDTNSFWNASTPSKITIPTTGDYLFGIEITFAAVTGNRTQRIQVLDQNNNPLIDKTYSVLSGLQMSMSGVSLHQLNAGDQLQAFGFQDSSGALNLLADPPNLPHWWIVLIGYNLY
jgi:hypothetical protein